MLWGDDGVELFRRDGVELLRFFRYLQCFLIPLSLDNDGDTNRKQQSHNRTWKGVVERHRPFTPHTRAVGTLGEV